MSRRIDIELTSKRDDSSWTWRAVGAREPKGVIAADLLPEGAAIGDELRVEADFFVDGIEITSVLPSKDARKEPERLEILGSGRDQGGVTTSLAPKRGRGDRRGRDDERSGDGRRRGPGRGDRSGRDRGPRDGGDRGRARTRRDGGDRPPRQRKPDTPAKPKPKRLKPKRIHRAAALEALPPEQRPIGEQVLRGGLPGVRKAVEEQNARNKAEGRTQIDPAPLLQLAEALLPGLKEAEWHDRADSALASIADLDLRDLRSVVVAADSAARSEETRALAEQLRQAVSDRVDSDQAAWLADITEALNDDRTVRALRMSSRPPKAGAPLPPELANRLTEAANVALGDDTGTQRWATVLDAVAYSPIRQSVTPTGIPSRPNDELLETVKRLSSRVPQIATLFGIDPQEAPKRRRRSRSSGRGQKSEGAKTPATPKSKDVPPSPAPTGEDGAAEPQPGTPAESVRPAAADAPPESEADTAESAAAETEVPAESAVPAEAEVPAEPAAAETDVPAEPAAESATEADAAESAAPAEHEPSAADSEATADAAAEPAAAEPSEPEAT